MTVCERQYKITYNVIGKRFTSGIIAFLHESLQAADGLGVSVSRIWPSILYSRALQASIY